ncbi:hypothetical protein CJF32_00008133 [Rutstroemia sp. NJR-2017a WRK4]|nr:hypothetical protein CJF32_00008133 [Rutstroemia sp. NJR-2017a WRK4]
MTSISKGGRVGLNNNDVYSM